MQRNYDWAKREGFRQQITFHLFTRLVLVILTRQQNNSLTGKAQCFWKHKWAWNDTRYSYCRTQTNQLFIDVMSNSFISIRHFAYFHSQVQQQSDPVLNYSIIMSVRLFTAQCLMFKVARNCKCSSIPCILAKTSNMRGN